MAHRANADRSSSYKNTIDAGMVQVGVWWLMAGVFVLACGAMAALFLPGPWRRGGRGTSAITAPGPLAGQASRSGQLGRTPPVRRAIWRHPVAWILALMVLTLAPALGTWWWSQHKPRQLDGYDDRMPPSDAQLTALLEGEHLIPPPPLPPDVFLTEIGRAHV